MLFEIFIVAFPNSDCIDANLFQVCQENSNAKGTIITRSLGGLFAMGMLFQKESPRWLCERGVSLDLNNELSSIKLTRR